jgi:hypothetical protein
VLAGLRAHYPEHQHKEEKEEKKGRKEEEKTEQRDHTPITPPPFHNPQHTMDSQQALDTTAFPPQHKPSPPSRNNTTLPQDTTQPTCRDSEHNEGQGNAKGE